MALDSPSVSWTEALKALPARDRLAWQRTITQDVSAQAAMAKQGPFSRAYMSGEPSSTEQGGLPFEASSCAGQRVSAVTHKFPSTKQYLADALQEACDRAGAPFTPSAVDSASANPLTDAIEQAASLDSAYRVIVAKALQRRLAGDAEWAAEAADPAASTRFQYLARIADGSLVAAAIAQKTDTPAVAVEVVEDHSRVTQRIAATGRDAMLDSAMDELLDAM